MLLVYLIVEVYQKAPLFALHPFLDLPVTDVEDIFIHRTVLH